MIAIPTVMKPAVTKRSCNGCALWPAAVIGVMAAVPKIADRVTAYTAIRSTVPAADTIPSLRALAVNERAAVKVIFR